MAMSMRMAAVGAATLLGLSEGLKVGMISDMHINLHYDPYIGVDKHN
jgi:hypothetical protein